MADILWQQGMMFLEWVLLGLFLVLFTNLSFGFCQFVFGFLMNVTDSLCFLMNNYGIFCPDINIFI